MLGLLKAFLSGLVRRLAGGASHGAPVLSKRWFQVTLMALLYAPTIYFHSYHTYLFDKLPHWLFVILATASVIISLIGSHFPSFKCGEEDPEYIKEQLEGGRKIKFGALADFVGKIRGLERFSREWCFYHLMMCKVIICIPAALLMGSQFMFAGACVAFAYNTAYWVRFKPFGKIIQSPTNFGEFVQGLFYFWAILG